MKAIRRLNIFLLIVAIICAIAFVVIDSNKEKYGNYEDKITIEFQDIESNSFGGTDVSFTVTNNGKAAVSKITFEMRIVSASNSYRSYTTEVSCRFNYLTNLDSENLKCSLSLIYADEWLVGKSKRELNFYYRITSVTFKNNKTYECENTQFVEDNQNSSIQNGGNQNQHAHDYKLKYDTEYHWQECSCGKSSVKVSHSYNTVNSDEIYHWQECSCGKQLTKELHNGNGNACLTCNYHYVFTEGVDYNMSSDGTYCEVVGYDGTDTVVRIKGAYHGVPVKSIGSQAFKNKNITNIVIPDRVTSIGASAFYDCDSLTSVTIGNGVTSIGSSAFYDCNSLTSVTIGNSVTSIGSSAFYQCDSLASIVIPNSVTSIDMYAFYGCYSLTSIVIPDSVTSIGSLAFHGCYSLTSVTIGNGVTSIGRYAFYACSSLTNIKYRGTQSQWNAISKGDYWFGDTGRYTIIYNYTGN